MRYSPKPVSRLVSAALASVLLTAPTVPLWGNFPGAMAETVSVAKPIQPIVNGNSLKLSLGALGNPEGYTLKTVRTERTYYFTRPAGWGVQPTSAVQVVFQHSPALLPERSSLNVKLNNRILKTISLSKANAAANTVSVPIPPNLLKDRNTLSFQVDQHYTYKCEDPFSAELWTTLLPETQLVLNYTPLPVKPDLAKYPFPLFDELSYGAAKVAYGVAPSASDETLSALGMAAASIGQAIQWRPAQPYLADPGSALSSKDNIVLVGTPAENPAIAQLSASLPVKVSGGRFVSPSGSAMGENDGVVQFVANPSNPSKAVLVISGNSPTGVLAAASALAQKPTNTLLAGSYEIVKSPVKPAVHPYRDWKGFLQHKKATFDELGLPSLTSRGVTGLPIHYQLKKMPDLFLPGKQKVKLRTVYSYSSQLDNGQSKLEVLLNGKSLKSFTLANKAGENMAVLDVDIPSEEVYTYNDLEYRFFMYPEKFDLCNFVTDAHIWGTIHSQSAIDVPGEVRTPLPDLGLLNDDGFPFTGFPDLSQTTFVLPESVNTLDVDNLLQIASRFGRQSSSRTGFSVQAVRASKLNDEAKKNNNLVIIGSAQRNAIFKELDSKSKLHLALTGDKSSLKGWDKTLAELQPTSEQGYLEEVLLPWNDRRVALLVYGQTDNGLKLTSNLFQNDDRFSALKPGNLVVINPNEAPKSMTVLNKGDARFLYQNDLQSTFEIPVWAWIVAGFLVVVGLVSIVRFIFGK